MEKTKADSTSSRRFSAPLLLIYTGLSWIIFRSALSGRGVGDTISDIALLLILVGVLYYVLCGFCRRSAMNLPVICCVIGVLLYLCLSALHALAVGSEAMLSASTSDIASYIGVARLSGNLAHSLSDKGMTLRLCIILPLIAGLLYHARNSRRISLLMVLSRHKPVYRAIRKATDGMYAMGRYGFYRLSVAAASGLLGLLLLTALGEPAAVGCAFSTLCCMFVPSIGWVALVGTIYPVLLGAYGSIRALRYCLIALLCCLLSETTLGRHLRPKIGPDSTPVAAISLCALALLGPGSALAAGSVFHGVNALLTRPARKSYRSPVSSKV